MQEMIAKMQRELEEKDKLIQKVASVVTQQPKKA